MPLSASEIHSLKQAPAVEGVLPAVHQRWSARSFTTQPVTNADLHRIFEAARWTASSNNEQPWRFLVARKGSETYSKIAETLMGFNKDWATNAPVLIVGAASTKFARNGMDNIYALFDLGGATNYLTLQAAALGLTTHQMAGYDHKALRATLGIPEDFALGTIVALGYQGDPAALADEQLIARETAPRTRKPLNEFVFTSWGQGTSLD